MSLTEFRKCQSKLKVWSNVCEDRMPNVSQNVKFLHRLAYLIKKKNN